MRYPSEWYQMQTMIAERLPSLRPAQQRGLTWWVLGTIRAHSICQNAVITALLTVGRWDTVRQYLRELLLDGKDKAAACLTEINVEKCFPELLCWVVSWWEGRDLVLAVDATLHGDRVVALVVSVLYRSSAIPVAFVILPANQKGPWMSGILRLLRLLSAAVPRGMSVLVLADQGLWSPRLWKRIRDLGWHPLLRVKETTTFQPAGGKRQSVGSLVPGPGHAWVGQGVAFRACAVRQAATLVVVWDEGQENPWVLLTDLPPAEIGVCWYGLRVWIELGFRALKSVGWQWQLTRRTDPTRVARSWLILAVATLLALATGTRAEDADRLGLPPARLRIHPRSPSQRVVKPAVTRDVSVFRLGLSWLNEQFRNHYVWRKFWLAPEPWPTPPQGLLVVVQHAFY